MKTIELTKGYSALVDDSDYDWLSKFKWHASGVNGRVYAKTSSHKQMHRMIANCPDGMVVDHINRNSLDNRRCNLRICTARQNTWNADRRIDGHYVGVKKKRKGFEAWHGSKSLGMFVSELAAAMAWDIEVMAQRGEFSVLNTDVNLIDKEWMETQRFDWTEHRRRREQMRNEFHRKLSDIMDSMALSSDDIASRMQCLGFQLTPERIDAWRSGDAYPETKFCKALEAVLGVNPTELFIF